MVIQKRSELGDKSETVMLAVRQTMDCALQKINSKIAAATTTCGPVVDCRAIGRLTAMQSGLPWPDPVFRL
jgi:hypothetical protein